MYLCKSNCDACGSPDVVSNKLDVAPFDRMSGGAAQLRDAGQPVAALGIVTLWGMTHVVNAFSHAHRCADCGHLFS